MKKLTFIFAMTLIATASAYAQSLPGRDPIGSETVVNVMRDPDPVRREERLVNISSRELGKSYKNTGALRSRSVPTFEAQIVVTNSNSKAIKAVSWMATLTDPNTGEVIGKYDIMTEARIAPGKRKKLEKKLPTPGTHVVSATSPRTIANLTTVVTRVTFEDGSNSDNP